MKFQPGSSDRSMWWMTLPAFFICAPLVAVAAVFMAFKLGFFIGGSALAGIIASGFSYVIYRNRTHGAHAANMGQTAASSCGSLAGIIAVLLQAFYWIGVGDDFDLLALGSFTLCASMLGVGIGMMYTPLLVDRMQLPYPTGRAVYEILRAMMTFENFKKAIAWLGGSIAASIGVTTNTPAFLTKWHFDASVFGAGMIAGPRITTPGLTMGLVGFLVAPAMLTAGWISEGQEFRHVAFYGGLSMMLGAAIVHIVEMLIAAKRKATEISTESSVLPGWVRNWTIVWTLLTFVVGVFVMDINPAFLLLGLAMAFIFVLVNGISTGVSDANPVTGAFVLTVLALVLIAGVDDKMQALLSASVLLMTIAVGVDMQQDRSTGWRLKSDRTMQFKFQVAGVVMGVFFGFILAPYFLNAYPELMDPAATTKEWSSAFTMKIVGSLDIIDGYKPYQLYLLAGGFVLGVVMQLARIKLRGKLEKNFVLDAVLLPSPYAFAFGAFVPFVYTVWFAVGGSVTGIMNLRDGYKKAGQMAKVDDAEEGAAESSGTAVPQLIGGGLIAGAGMAYLWMGFSRMFGG